MVDLADKDDESNVHTRVARLSISTTLEERKKVMSFLKENSPSVSPKKGAISSGSSSDETSTGSNGSRGPKKAMSSKFTKPDLKNNVIDNSAHSKRRRSSVQSATKLKKKKKFLASPEFKFDPKYSKKKVGIASLRDAILWCLVPNHANPTWVDIINRNSIKRVLFLFVPGLTSDLFGLKDLSKTINPQSFEPLEELSFFSKFPYLLPTAAPGSKDSLFSSLQTLTSIPLTDKEKKRLVDESEKRKLILPDLLLNYQEMISQDYPIHSEVVIPRGLERPPLEEGWKETIRFEHPGSKTFAMDCEMCMAASGKVLTRVSLVDFNKTVLLDELVKPEEEITDYVTKYSGITEEMLKDVHTSLADIQEKLIKLISSDDILIGHSLESDLTVLQMRHPRIIDTSVIYEHPRGPPLKASLRWLTTKYLARTIQDSDHGHSSIEDSEAALDLVKLKLLKGEYYGKNVAEESLFARLNKSNIKSVLVDYNSKLVTDSIDRVLCENDDEITEGILNNLDEYDFVFGRLRELEFGVGWCPAPRSFNGETICCEDVEEKQQQIVKLYRNLNDRLERIYSKLPPSTGLMISSSSGNPTEMIKLQNDRRTFQNEIKMGKEISDIEVPWTDEKYFQLRCAADVARDSLAFMIVKNDKNESDEDPNEVAVEDD